MKNKTTKIGSVFKSLREPSDGILIDIIRVLEEGFNSVDNNKSLFNEDLYDQFLLGYELALPDDFSAQEELEYYDAKAEALMKRVPKIVETVCVPSPESQHGYSQLDTVDVNTNLEIQHSLLNCFVLYADTFSRFHKDKNLYAKPEPIDNILTEGIDELNLEYERLLGWSSLAPGACYYISSKSLDNHEFNSLDSIFEIENIKHSLPVTEFVDEMHTCEKSDISLVVVGPGFARSIPSVRLCRDKYGRVVLIDGSISYDVNSRSDVSSVSDKDNQKLIEAPLPLDSLLAPSPH